MTDYKKLYEGALERAKYWAEGKCMEGFYNSPQNVLDFVFPETKKVEDEKIKNEIVGAINIAFADGENRQRCLGWLENLKSAKSTDESVEWVPKFKTGDKIRSNNGMYEDEVVSIDNNGAYSLKVLGELYLPENEWSLVEEESSEDEKIRKEIIDYLKDFIPHHDYDLVAKSRIWIAWLEKQGEKTNPYSGISFEYNGHIWGMCARDNGVDILLDKQLFKHLDEKQGENDMGISETTKQELEDNLNKAIEKETPESWNKFLDEQGEQKPTDKVESKFHAGDFITDGKRIFKIEETVWERNIGKIGSTYCESLIVNLEDGNTYANNTDLKEFHLWTIEDAKDGDVLVDINEGKPFIFKKTNTGPSDDVASYCDIFYNIFHAAGTWTTTDIIPATKEQHDLLFTKMKEAGYEWDVEKKELKKIEQKPVEEVNGEDYGIDGLYAAMDILNKTLGQVEGYQSDDGILEHKAAITTVKKLYKQNHVEWSEKDENTRNKIIGSLDALKFYVERNDKFDDERVKSNLKELEDEIKWLQDFVPQPKQEWTDEDEGIRDFIISIFKAAQRDGVSEPISSEQFEKIFIWLRQLKERMK